MSTPSGIHAPVTTPFDSRTGEIDKEALQANVTSLLASGLAGVVLFGSTGEGPLIDAAERPAALKAAREVVGEGWLMAGVAAESTQRAIKLVAAAEAAGADAVLVAPPSYFLPQLTAEALRDHYLTIADAAAVPVLLYQVPLVYSGADLKPDLVVEISEHPRIAGIKDSTGNLDAMGRLVEGSREGFMVIVGSGTAVYGGLRVGAAGGILAIANLAPAQCVELYDLKQEGREGEAAALQERLGVLHSSVVGRHGVPGVKAALDHLGRVGGDPRMPLRRLEDGGRADVRNALIQAGLLEGDEDVG